MVSADAIGSPVSFRSIRLKATPQDVDFARQDHGNNGPVFCKWLKLNRLPFACDCTHWQSACIKEGAAGLPVGNSAVGRRGTVPLDAAARKL
jgi:hypothetical protein